MYTQCSSCATLFRVTSRHLSVARGQVRCCLCHARFDALASLTDYLPPGVSTEDAEAARIRGLTPSEPASVVREGRYGTERTFRVNPPADDLPRVTLPTTGGEQASGGEGGRKEPVIDQDWPDEIEAEPAVAAVDPGEPEVSAAAPQSSREPEWDVPLGRPELDEPPPLVRSRRGGLATAAWSIAIVSLMGLLFLQYAYVMRAELAAHASLRPALERMCEVLGCDLPAWRDLDRIQVVQRQVKLHPEAEGGLLIEATLLNEADRRQPFPQVGFSLFDGSGQVVGRRWFEAQEYLPEGRARALRGAGMAPGEPVRIRLELRDPGSGSDNFEFKFR